MVTGACSRALYMPLKPAQCESNTLLLKIVTNDIAVIFSGLKVTLKLFADDVKLYSCYDTTADDDDLR